MKRLACIILITAILASGLAFKTPANAATVSGTLTADTHWTMLDSPINFNGSVTVASGKTLTIDPGVVVNLQRYSLVIGGTIIAVGSEDQRIIFTIAENASQYISGSIFFSSSSVSWNDTTSSGSIIQNADFNRVVVYVENSPKIDNCRFSFSTVQSAISIMGSSPIITNNNIVFTGQDPGHYAYGVNVNKGSPVVSNNRFEGVGGITTNSETSFIISNNQFINGWFGVRAQGRAVLTVEGNSFFRCNDGLDITEGASVTIRNNLIDSSARYGINGGGAIISNTITNNQVGIHNPHGGSIITDNNIVGNSVNSVTATFGSINAQNNWWGTTDIPTINQTIYDKYDDPSLGEIMFVPFLSGPSTSAPAIPATTPIVTPIPTVNPTQPPVQPTPTPTFPPTLEPTPTEKSEPILNDSSDLLNLNIIITSIITIIIVTWIIVILGYVAKGTVYKYKTRGRKSESKLQTQ